MCVEFLVPGGFLNKQQWSHSKQLETEWLNRRQTKVNIALVFLLPISLHRHLTSLPSTPYFSWILPGYSHKTSIFFFLSSRLLQVAGSCSPLAWSFLGSFSSNWGLASLPLLCSLVCPVPCLWTTLMGQLCLL